MNNRYILGSVLVTALVCALAWWFWSTSYTTTPHYPGPSTEVANPSIEGTWRSTDDARFIREFQQDGTVIDTYASAPDATSIGIWTYVENPLREQPDLPVDNGDTVLKISFAEEVLYFGVSELSENRLVLLYLGGNGILTFERI